MKVCNKCNRDLPLELFELIKSKYRRGTCNSCRYKESDKDKAKKRWKKSYFKMRADRVRSILNDCKDSDRTYGRNNDLCLSFVQQVIKNSCHYCGDLKRKKTLDRIDNSIGHLQSNVVVACIRCNYIRRDMPYEAFLVISKTIIEVDKLGLFKDWVPGPYKNF